jgi:hypothetical protein
MSMRMPDSSPPDYSRSANVNEGVLMSLLLQRHRAGMTRVLVTSVVSRLICVGIAIYITLPAHLSVSEVVGAAVVTTATAAVWQLGNRRTSYQLAAIERAVGRQIGGQAEDFYIDALAGSHRYSHRLTAYEEYAWIIINGILLTISILTKGIGSWHGFGY